ncbi:MAG: ROK family transcriptional regulator [Cetobacterium sp.]|uniref:ROK family transcriptional regulator n=1 Tax=Cetobacterium sp. TaxID=2071632 RepID=UPI003F3C3AB9
MKTKDKILNLIYFNPGINREILAKNLNLSLMAISKILKNLKNNNIIYEIKNPNIKLGRPCNLLYFNYSSLNILGIHLSLEKIKFIISNSSLEIKLKKELLIRNSFSPEKIIKLIENQFKEIIKLYNIHSISIAMNGIVNSRKGISILSSNYNWNNIDIVKELKKYLPLSIPIIINNGSNLLAFFEKSYHKNPKVNLVSLNLNQGIGAGVIIDGSLYEGSFFQVGEIGHVPFEPSKNFLICSCGKKGCLETIVSKWRIEEKVFKEKNIKLNFTEIIKKANEGIEYYKDIFREVAKALAYTIIWINNLLDPEEISINGEITTLNSFFKKELFRILKENNFNKAKEINIKLNTFDDDAIIKGAIILGQEMYIKKLLLSEQ